MMKSARLAGASIALVAVVGCVSFKMTEKSLVHRGVASVSENEKGSDWYKDLEDQAKQTGGTLEFPKGFDLNQRNDRRELAGLLHWSEGSDYYPLRWMVSLRSQFYSYDLFKDKSQKYKSQYIEPGQTRFLEDLDIKHGLIPSPENLQTGEPNEYFSKWIGLVSSWSSLPDTDYNKDVKVSSSLKRSSDNFYSDEVLTSEQVRAALGVRTVENIDGQREKSIAMAGINCALCHTEKIRGSAQIIFGGPGMVNMRGYFRDLFGSTMSTMLNQENLEQFLQSVYKSNREEFDSAYAKDRGRFSAKEVAANFVGDFVRDLGIEVPKQREVLGNLLYSYEKKKKNEFREKLFAKNEVVASYLMKLLTITYPNLQGEISPELKTRMVLLSRLAASDPSLEEEGYNEGYAHSDAFSRLTNAMVRSEAVKVKGIVSTPPAWAIKYKSMFHWNANTSSVGSRNIGQAHGLGAVVIGEDNVHPEGKRATSNLINLGRLEITHYRVKIPRWEEVFADNKFQQSNGYGGEYKTGASFNELKNGCKVYYKTCANCHSSSTRVGPTNQLVHDPIIPHSALRTDPWYSKHQASAVTYGDQTSPHRQRIIEFTEVIRNQYLEKYGNKSLSDGESVHELVGEPKFRPETVLFRDTYLQKTYRHPEGDCSSKEGCFPHGEASGYPARSLAGVWATAPYLHNGTVVNLTELLKPAASRASLFFAGSNEYDPQNLGFKSGEIKDKGFLSRANEFGSMFERARCNKQVERCVVTGANARDGQKNIGHEYGINLNNSDRKDLINFMKVLQPEPEYSWKNPYYVVRGEKADRSCEFYAEKK